METKLVKFHRDKYHNHQETVLKAMGYVNPFICGFVSTFMVVSYGHISKDNKAFMVERAMKVKPCPNLMYLWFKCILILYNCEKEELFFSPSCTPTLCTYNSPFKRSFHKATSDQTVQSEDDY